MVIEINGVNKKIGSKQVIQDVSLSIGRGQVFALLGPNGAGKTTLIRIILGLLRAETGTIRLFGQELTAQSRSDLLLRIGVQNDGNLYENLTIEDNLALWGQIYGLDQATIKRRLDELKQKFHLEAYSNMPVGSLSKGNRQKVMLARAMFHNPEVLILDEPTTGLDPQARRNLWELIKTIRDEGMTIVLTTHYMDEAELLCDRLAIMDNGKIITIDTPHNLIQQLLARGFKKKQVVEQANLEDVFIDLTGKAIRD